MTASEKLLWEKLRKKQQGARFHRQAVVWGYIADFWCPQWNLVVELDGSFHEGREEYDARRDQNLLERGIKTIRFESRLVFSHMDYILEAIRAEGRYWERTSRNMVFKT